MSERIVPGPLCGEGNLKEAVCINAEKIYDSCKDKDCLEDLRVYLTRCGDAILDKAINVKTKGAEIIWTYIDVEPVPFNKGFYAVSIKYFFKVTFDAFCGVGKPQEIEGLCTYDKKVILFGSEGNAKIFSSKYRPGDNDLQLLAKNNMPKATVEVVEPIALGCRVVEPSCRCNGNDFEIAGLPDFVCGNFGDELTEANDKNKLLVTLGIFSIVRLERNVQLLIPAYDFCMPEKECVSSTEDDPCKLFRKIKFPTDEFFPPRVSDFVGEDRDRNCGCR